MRRCCRSDAISTILVDERAAQAYLVVSIVVTYTDRSAFGDTNLFRITPEMTGCLRTNLIVRSQHFAETQRDDFGMVGNSSFTGLCKALGSLNGKSRVDLLSKS